MWTVAWFLLHFSHNTFITPRKVFEHHNILPHERQNFIPASFSALHTAHFFVWGAEGSGASGIAARSAICGSNGPH